MCSAFLPPNLSVLEVISYAGVHFLTFYQSFRKQRLSCLIFPESSSFAATLLLVPSDCFSWEQASHVGVGIRGMGTRGCCNVKRNVSSVMHLPLVFSSHPPFCTCTAREGKKRNFPGSRCDDVIMARRGLILYPVFLTSGFVFLALIHILRVWHCECWSEF